MNIDLALPLPVHTLSENSDLPQLNSYFSQFKDEHANGHSSKKDNREDLHKSSNLLQKHSYLFLLQFASVLSRDKNSYKG